MEALDLNWSWDQDRSSGRAQAWANVWSRAARRQQGSNKGPTSGAEPVLTVSITIHPDSVTVRWLKGSDTVLYESFCGMLRRSVVT